MTGSHPSKSAGQIVAEIFSNPLSPIWSFLRIIFSMVCLTIILATQAQHFDQTELVALAMFFVVHAAGEAGLNWYMQTTGAKWKDRLERLEKDLEREREYRRRSDDRYDRLIDALNRNDDATVKLMVSDSVRPEDLRS